MKLNDLYQSVTNKVIADIEAGTPPWVKPWKSANAIGPLLPENAISGNRYRGVNIPILWSTALECGYPSHQWLTYKQANGAGGHIRKGERGCTVVFTKWVERENDNGETEKRPILRTYTVFNVSQVEDLPAEYHPQPEEDVGGHAGDFFKSLDVRVKHGDNKAYYNPRADCIMLPRFDTFLDGDAYFATRAHESIHATGHENRLKRKLCGQFGDSDYAFEELIAELGGSFLCAAIGVQYDTQSAASYIDNWLKALKNDTRYIFKAASFASQAADYWLEQAQHAVTTDTPACERAS